MTDDVRMTCIYTISTGMEMVIQNYMQNVVHLPAEKNSTMGNERDLARNKHHSRHFLLAESK
jgi:hypothetical protein